MDTLHEDQYTFTVRSRLVLLRITIRKKMFETEVAEKIKTHILYSIMGFFSRNLATYVTMLKILKGRISRGWQYGACTLYVGYLRLQTHTQNMQSLLLFHFNNGFRNAHHCWFIRKLFVLFRIIVSLRMTCRRSKYVSFYAHKLCCPNMVVF
jgi:hypothetical protein